MVDILRGYNEQFSNMDNRQSKIEDQLTTQNVSLQYMKANIDLMMEKLFGPNPPQIQSPTSNKFSHISSTPTTPSKELSLSQTQETPPTTEVEGWMKL